MKFIVQLLAVIGFIAILPFMWRVFVGFAALAAKILWLLVIAYLLWLVFKWFMHYLSRPRIE